jgi:hypothetical protein
MAISICRGCHEPKGLSNFSTNNTRGTGKEAYCRPCGNIRRRKRRQTRKREKIALKLGQRYCHGCETIQPPEAFSTLRQAGLSICNACLTERD